MEVMEIAIAAVRDVSYVAKFYPVFALFGAVVIILLLFRFYCRLTLGTCDCTTDMTGKTVIVTGANTGIGKCTAMEIARRGARVIMACRNKEKGQKALDEIVRETGNHEIILKVLDLCSFASVRAFVEDILKTERHLHVLINNAGILASDQREVTGDGCEKTMQSNHLGHFLMTLLLLDMLKKSAPSRIINVSSEGHRMARLHLNDLNCANHKYNYITVYGSTKVANVLFTRELCRRLRGTGVTANSLHPGVVNSEFVRPSTNIFMRIMFRCMLFVCGKTSLEGAQTTIHLALSPNLRNVSGKYFMDCKQKEESDWSKSDERASELWKISEKLVGLEH